MSKKLRINITASRIQLEVPAHDWVLSLANRVAYDRQTLKMLSLGESELDAQRQMGEGWAAFRQQAVFERLFEPAPAGPVFDFFALEYWLAKADAAVAPKLGWLATFGLGEHWDYELQIDTYDQLSKGRRLELDCYLQAAQRAKTLRINGQVHTIALSRRRLEMAMRLLLTLVAPFAVLYLGITASFSRSAGFTTEAWLTLLLAVVGAVVLYVLGLAAWLLLMRRWLPGSYLRYQLRRMRSLRPLARWLADRLLP